MKPFLKLTLCDSCTHKILIPNRCHIMAVLGNWQNSKATIKEESISLFNKDLLSDVSFVIEASSHRLDVSISAGPRGAAAPAPLPTSYNSVQGAYVCTCYLRCKGGFFCVTGLGGLYLEGLIHGGAYFRNFTVPFLVQH